MSETETLYRIQELDAGIHELRGREENHPLKEELAKLEEEAESNSGELETAVSSLEASKNKQGGMEKEVQQYEEKQSREEDKLYSGEVSSPKELRGLQAEVRSIKKHKDTLETDLLEEMERLDELDAAMGEIKSKAEGLRSLIDEKRKELDGEIAGIRDELARLEGEKAELRSGLDEELLELYDHLLESRQNLAVVKVIEGVCQGCRVELPGMEYDRFLKADTVFRCTNCGRIMVK